MKILEITEAPVTEVRALLAHSKRDVTWAQARLFHSIHRESCESMRSAIAKEADMEIVMIPTEEVVRWEKIVRESGIPPE